MVPGSPVFSASQLAAFRELAEAERHGPSTWIPTAADEARNMLTTDTALLPKFFCRAVKLQPEFRDGEGTKIATFSVTGDQRNQIDFTMDIMLTEVLRGN
jgi:hypothetical protein